MVRSRVPWLHRGEAARRYVHRGPHCVGRICRTGQTSASDLAPLPVLSDLPDSRYLPGRSSMRGAEPRTRDSHLLYVGVARAIGPLSLTSPTATAAPTSGEATPRCPRTGECSQRTRRYPRRSNSRLLWLHSSTASAALEQPVSCPHGDAGLRHRSERHPDLRVGQRGLQADFSCSEKDFRYCISTSLVPRQCAYGLVLQVAFFN